MSTITDQRIYKVQLYDAQGQRLRAYEVEGMEQAQSALADEVSQLLDTDSYSDELQAASDGLVREGTASVHMYGVCRICITR